MSDIKIKDDARQFADMLKGHIEIVLEENDPSRGLAIIKDNAPVWVDNFPENLTVESATAYQQYLSLTGAGGLLAVGEVGIPFMEKHKDVKNISLVLPTIGKDQMEFNIKRSAEYPIPGKPGETVTKYGQAKVVHSCHSTRPVGDMGRIMAHLGELATKTLTK